MREARVSIKFSREQIQRAEEVFSSSRVDTVPGMQMDDIMYNSGIRKVLDWLAQNEGHLLPRRPRDTV